MNAFRDVARLAIAGDQDAAQQFPDAAMRFLQDSKGPQRPASEITQAMVDSFSKSWQFISDEYRDVDGTVVRDADTAEAMRNAVLQVAAVLQSYLPPRKP